jgi:hypothetical protein
MVAWLDYGLPVAAPAVANRARDTRVCPVPELTSSCVGSPRTLRASVRLNRLHCCHMPYRLQITSNATTPGPLLNGRHARPVDAYHFSVEVVEADRGITSSSDRWDQEQISGRAGGSVRTWRMLTMEECRLQLLGISVSSESKARSVVWASAAAG